jgi:hypothetical protein
MAMEPYHEHDFVDYFQLLKVDGRWWIVSKLFDAVPLSIPVAMAHAAP